MKFISILITDDHLLTRLGLRMILERSSDFRVVGEAEDGFTALEKCKELLPNVVLMDIRMPVMDGIETTKRIKESLPETQVLMLTSHEQEDEVFAALAAGADGYCLKSISEQQLASAIRCVLTGGAWLDPEIARMVLKFTMDKFESGRVSLSKGPKSKFALSSREIEVLKLIVDGCSNREIAEHLVLSMETVKTHVRHITEKLAVSDRTQAAVKALRNNLV